MYFIWRNIMVTDDGIKQYIGKTPSQTQAEWIVQELIGEPDVAIAHWYGQCDVWYGYDYVPKKVPEIKSPKAFTEKYVSDFQDENNHDIKERRLNHE